MQQDLARSCRPGWLRSTRQATHHPARQALVASAFTLLLGPLAAWAAGDEPAATPYRPTVAGGVALTEPGWLELEVGAQRLGGKNSDRRGSLPYLLKWAASDDWGLLLGGDARVTQRPEGQRSLSGVGDTVLTLKVHLSQDRPSGDFGLEASAKLPTAKDGLGSGRSDQAIKGIYSVDLPRGLHLDANLGVLRQGDAQPGQSRSQWGWAAAVSHPAGQAWTLALDLSGTRQRGAPSSAQLMGAASLSLSKRVVVDGGLARGLNDATPRWTVFAGLTVLLGQLF